MGEAARVLYCDDEPHMRELFSELLEDSHFELVLARDGQEAIDLLQAEAFDGVVTDIEMPRLCGAELISRIKKTKRI